jgi:hypothetical protein
VSAEEVEYGLVMPFVTCASKGGPHDDGSYVAGWEMGALDAYLSYHQPSLHVVAIHAENVPQADLIAMKHGYRMELAEDEQVEGWEVATLTKYKDAMTPAIYAGGKP